METNDPERCLQNPASAFLSCGAELAGLAEALAPAGLDGDGRKAVDDGRGLGAECVRARTAADYLALCPSAARAAGPTAQALPAANSIAVATEEAIQEATDFQRCVRAGTLLFLAALGVFPEAIRGALQRRLGAEGLSDEDRDGLEADLTALTAPVESDAERARDAQLRFQRRKDELRAEVDAAERGAAEERARFQVEGAVRRGEALPPEALLTIRPAPEATPPSPRRRTRR